MAGEITSAQTLGGGFGCSSVNMKKQVLPAWNFLQCDGNLFTPRRAYHTAVMWDKKMFVWGGAYTSGSNAVVMYDTVAKLWGTVSREQASSPPPLISHSAVVFQDAMWVYGGAHARTGFTTGDIYAFSFPHRTWELVTPHTPAMPPPRARHCAVAFPPLQGMLIFGGEHVGPEGAHLLEDLWLFHFPTMSWRQLDLRVNPSVAGTSLRPKGRKHATLCYHDGVGYLFGGTDGKTAMSDFFFLEAGEDGAVYWTPHSESEGSGFPPMERWGHTAVAYGGRMHLFGGKEVGSGTMVPSPGEGRAFQGYILNDWRKFSFKYKMWIRLSSHGHVPLPRWGHSCCECGGVMYIFGGLSSRGFLNDLYSISLAPLSTVLSDLNHPCLISHDSLALPPPGPSTSPPSSTFLQKRRAQKEHSESIDVDPSIEGRQLLKAGR
eukprot:Sspe_Gene.79012::Locus_49503_Transcript_1_1_Confidence_1.000_Length_1395::g.79012::m.79012